MKSFKLVRFVFWAALALLSGRDPLAQTINLGVTVVTNAANTAEIFFVVAFTNRLAAPIANVRITNVLDGATAINSNVLNINDQPPGTTVRNDRFSDATPPRVETEIALVPANAFVRLTIAIPRPANLSDVTDTVDVYVGAESFTDSARGDEAVAVDAGGGNPDTRGAGDLSVFFVILPNSNPIQGDLFDLGIVATNRGPGAVTGIILTNIFDGLVIRGVTPTQTIATNAAGAVPINVGTLQANTAIQFTFNLTTTNSETFNLSSTIGSASNVDPDALNNSAEYDLAVAATNSPNVTVSIGTAQEDRPDLQTGLFTEIVNVRNDSDTDPIPAFRLNVFGMNATNILYNAQGTNSGIPFVVYPVAVPPLGTASVRLEFFNSRRRPVPTTFTNYFVTELRSFDPTNSVATTTNIFTWVTREVEGDPIVNFPATVGNRYTIVYSDNVLFTNNVFRAYPSFIAPGNIVQWRDTGPPKTLPHTPTRFYRVLEGQ